jgi:serine/threonine protein kinase/dienelactone hydrolase
MTIGTTVSHYRILALIGAGGMGEVYKAEDTRLKRAVALKFLSPALVASEEAKKRLVAEAQAVSALDHPNICTILEIDESDEGRLFLAMAYYEGETLKERLDRGPMNVDEAIEIILQVVRAVTAAHAAGIIHRDIKPANIFLCSTGVARAVDSDATSASSARFVDKSARVKLLDFGIAKVPGRTALTRTGTTIGTVAYMAPEHIAGKAIDERADVWSLGVVLYELIAGRLPFSATHEVALIRAIENEAPLPLAAARPDVPPEVARVADRALRKNPTERYASAAELLHDLEALHHIDQATAPAARSRQQPRPRFGRRTVVAAAAVLAVTVIAAGGWLTVRALRAREAERLTSEIRRLVEQDEYAAAFRQLHTAPAAVAESAAFARLRNDSFISFSVTTEPPGADVYVKGYGEPEAEWIHLGQSPIETRGTFVFLRWRISQAGSSTFEGTGPSPGAIGNIAFTLKPAGAVPDDMVAVSGGPIAGGARLPDFFIDRYEVTNRAYKRFVDAGGYRNAQFWQEPFANAGRTLSWDEAMAEFRDPTGRPGPAGWELGTYPEGHADWPVSGVSWYEAMAYARFAGKALPTVHHWRQAAVFGLRSDILEWSNFSGRALARVGEYQGIGSFGTYDMAGNVKEWCANAVGDLRYILGGGWNEPNYQYRESDARRPFDRSANNGFRLITLPDPTLVPADAYGPVVPSARDYTQEKPVGDDAFRALTRLYAYDHSDAKDVVESTDDAPDAWRIERVSYNAPYGNERIAAYLFLPKHVAAPYQTIVYFPHSGGFSLDSFQQAEMAYLGFLVKSGRALLFPMYKGLYERRLKPPATGTNAVRDLMIQQVKEVSRSIDYLSTRPDIDPKRLAFFGVSLGANLAPMVLAMESRFRTAILWSGGFPSAPRPPETDPINFAPRVTTPVLMLNGRDDFTFPVETSQEPMFRLLGTPDADKKRGLYDGGHVFPFSRMIKDSLDWLDRYLGTPAELGTKN